MIVLCGYIDLTSGLAWEIWENKERKLDVGMSLVGPLIYALDAFVKELTFSKRGFSEGALEDLRMILYQPPEPKKGDYFYVVFQHLYDSIDYTHRKIKLVDNVIGEHLSANVFNPPKDSIKNAIDILKFTQKFPEGLITAEEYIVQEKMTQLEEKGVIFLDLFLADIDEGLMIDFVENDLIEKTPNRLFHDLLASVQFEDSLYLETIADKRVINGLALEKQSGILEGWIVQSIKDKVPTDFFIVAYFVFNPSKCSCQEIKEAISSISTNFYEKIKDHIQESPIWKTS